MWFRSSLLTSVGSGVAIAPVSVTVDPSSVHVAARARVVGRHSATAVVWKRVNGGRGTG